MSNVDFFAIASIAFIGSFGHCIGMCGGIVMAYTTTKINSSFTRLKVTLAHLSYSFGRVSVYVMFGAIFGAIGSVISFSDMANGMLLIFAGVVMILAGVSLSGKIRFLVSIEHSIINFDWYRKIFANELGKNTIFSFFVLGLLNGLLPCGLVYFFAISAASSASAVDGALVMLIFGLATIPTLFAFGFVVGFLRNSSIRQLFIKIASVMIVLYGVYVVYSGYLFIDGQKTLYSCHG